MKVGQFANLALALIAGLAFDAPPLSAQTLPARHPAQLRHAEAVATELLQRARSEDQAGLSLWTERPGPVFYWQSPSEMLSLAAHAEQGRSWSPAERLYYGLRVQYTPGWWSAPAVDAGSLGPLPSLGGDQVVKVRLYPDLVESLPSEPVDLSLVALDAAGQRRVLRREVIGPQAWQVPGFVLFLKRRDFEGVVALRLESSGEDPVSVPLPLPRQGARIEERFEGLLAAQHEWSPAGARVLEELYLWRERGARAPHGQTPGRLIAGLEAELSGEPVRGVAWPQGATAKGPWTYEPAGVSAGAGEVGGDVERERERGALVFVHPGGAAPDDIFNGSIGQSWIELSERWGWSLIAISSSGLGELGSEFERLGLSSKAPILLIPRGAALLPARLWATKNKASWSGLRSAVELRYGAPAEQDSPEPRLWAPGLERSELPWHGEAGALPCFSDAAWLAPVEAWLSQSSAEATGGGLGSGSTSGEGKGESADGGAQR